MKKVFFALLMLVVGITNIYAQNGYVTVNGGTPMTWADFKKVTLQDGDVVQLQGDVKAHPFTISNDITLDLNNWTLIRNHANTTTNYFIRLLSTSSGTITIKNGTLSDYYDEEGITEKAYTVNIKSVGKVLLDNVTIETSGTSSYVIGGVQNNAGCADVTIKDCSITVDASKPIGLRNVSNCVVQGSIFNVTSTSTSTTDYAEGIENDGTMTVEDDGDNVTTVTVTGTESVSGSKPIGILTGTAGSSSEYVGETTIKNAKVTAKGYGSVFALQLNGTTTSLLVDNGEYSAVKQGSGSALNIKADNSNYRINGGYYHCFNATWIESTSKNIYGGSFAGSKDYDPSSWVATGYEASLAAVKCPYCSEKSSMYVVTPDYEVSQTVGGVTTPIYLESGGSLAIDETAGTYTSFEVTKEVSNVTVSYTRNFKQANTWYAFVLPFDIQVTEDLLTKYKFGKICDAQYSDSTTYIKCRQMKVGQVIGANTPALVKSTETGANTLTFAGVTLEPTANMVDLSAATTEYTYNFCGTYTTITNMFSSKKYALSKGMFCYAYNDGVTLSPFRMYMQIIDKSTGETYYNINTPQAVRLNFTGLEEEETAVQSVESNTQSSAIYDLMGRKVITPQAGHIYIKNGKKVIY